MNYNKTQLHPELAFERHVFHRDMFAHFLRWTHVLKLAKIGMNILDVGCGNGNLYEVFYRNRYNPNNFTGIDIRKQTIEKNRSKFPKAIWFDKDIVNDSLPDGDWDIISSFEVIEHIGKSNGEKFLSNINKVMKDKTIFLLSTPCYDENVGAAANHTYDDGDGIKPQEYTFEELEELLEKHFMIKDVFGTFASQKDYKHLLNDWQLKMYEHLTRYYDSNLVANLMAPFFPRNSRNCLWILTKKI